MRIAFWLMQDSIRNWSHWIAGFYYIKNCLQALAQLPANERPQVYAFVPEALIDKLTESTDFAQSSWLTIVPIAESMLVDRAGIERLERLVAEYDCDVLFPALTPPLVNVKSKIIGWIPDYQHRVYPGFFSESELAYRDKMFAFLTGISDTIVCSSQTVEADLQRFYPIARERGFVLRFTAEPPESALRGDIRDTLQRFEIDQPYAYLPYQFWAHKNHQQVFEAWSLLKSRGKNFLLVCSGATHDARDPQHFERLQAMLKSHDLTNVRVLGMIDRHDQWQLYRGAKMVLQPSLFEGWSTSVEEAKSLGKPVLLSDIEVHREQILSPESFFQPHDVTGLANLIEGQWSTLPAGHEPVAESLALQACRSRVLTFGRDLVQLFEQTLATNREPIAEAVLPLYLFMQQEAEARLQVIDGLMSQLQQAKSNEAELAAQPTVEHSTAGKKISNWFHSLRKTA
ncbi:MAG: glycosyltransferase family 4 protein [Pirellulaceae bacterium]|jgi:glycosyltransferase involved in cell wall biosynthesis|nr:glycosyltransferase family 4 protein [Pirellulaceae bacterium]